MPASPRYIQSVLGSPETVNTVARVLEPAATMTTATAAEPVAGIAALLTGDADTVGRVQDRLTYNPRSRAGQEGLKALSDAFVEMAEAVGIDDAVAYFEDTVVPSLQSKFGDEIGAAMGAGLMAGAAVIPVPARKIKAYHGSPHDFDEFSTDAIGTGEGAQMYGHGLYFAESEDVAKGYRDSLMSHQLKNVPAPYKAAAESFKEYGFSVDDAKFGMRSAYPDISDADLDLALRSGGYGGMYEVDINVSPEELLDFDAPINQQPQIMKAFRSETFESEMESPGEMRGMDLLRMLNEQDVGSEGQYSSPKAASRLQEAGIKGIKYADAFTRHKSPSKQTKNYVIFDERLISIAKKYGVAVPAAAVMLSEITGDDPESLYEEA